MIFGVQIKREKERFMYASLHDEYGDICKHWLFGNMEYRLSLALVCTVDPNHDLWKHLIPSAVSFGRRVPAVQHGAGGHPLVPEPPVHPLGVFTDLHRQFGAVHREESVRQLRSGDPGQILAQGERKKQTRYWPSFWFSLHAWAYCVIPHI